MDQSGILTGKTDGAVYIKRELFWYLNNPGTAGYKGIKIGISVKLLK